MNLTTHKAAQAARVLLAIERIEDIADGHSMFVDLNDAAESDQAVTEIYIDGDGYVDYARDLLVDHSPRRNSKADRALQALRDPEVAKLVGDGLVQMGRSYIARRRRALLRTA